MFDMQQVGSRISKLRKSIGITQTGLADRLGITKVSLQFLLRLAVVYTVTFLGCMLWQWGYGRVKQCLRPQAR